MQNNILTTRAREIVQNNIDSLNKMEDGGREVGLLSDGYHTFDELYEFRMLYNAALFNEWAKLNYFTGSMAGWAARINSGKEQLPLFDVHKSWKHHDGEDCFGGGWFIVSAMLPTGQISNHYRAEHWDLFKIPESEKAKYEFDGHTPQDVVERLKSVL